MPVREERRHRCACAHGASERARPACGRWWRGAGCGAPPRSVSGPPRPTPLSHGMYWYIYTFTHLSLKGGVIIASPSALLTRPRLTESHAVTVRVTSRARRPSRVVRPLRDRASVPSRRSTQSGLDHKSSGRRARGRAKSNMRRALRHHRRSMVTLLGTRSVGPTRTRWRCSMHHRAQPAVLESCS